MLRQTKFLRPFYELFRWLCTKFALASTKSAYCSFKSKTFQFLLALKWDSLTTLCQRVTVHLSFPRNQLQCTTNILYYTLQLDWNAWNKFGVLTTCIICRASSSNTAEYGNPVANTKPLKIDIVLPGSLTASYSQESSSEAFHHLNVSPRWCLWSHPIFQTFHWFPVINMI